MNHTRPHDRLITPSGRPLTRRALPAGLLAGMACLLLIGSVLAGCASPNKYKSVADRGAVTYTGPKYLRGTIGSYGSFVNNGPRYVGGYGMVVDLNATGSNEVPAWLRDWLRKEMLRNNVGSALFGTERFTPERVMADLGSSVVAVEGLIPPGAAQGSKFDLLVTMVDQTSTSLAGGRLFWPTQLSPTGLDRSLTYTESLAAGYGPLFVNPVKSKSDGDTEFMRRGVVVNGGTVLVDQKIQFVLNAPSHRVSSLVANRINARFESADTDNLKTAVAKNEGLIEINVPSRFASQPELLLSLIATLYLDPSPGFIKPQANALAKSLLENPEQRARAVAQAWKGLGRNATPVLRSYYNHANPIVQFAALDAGSWLNDKQAAGPLMKIAKNGSPAERVRAARALVAMTRSSEARQAVRLMLNDPDPDVRLGAYEALAMVNDLAIDRLSVKDGKAHKFFIDRVPSKYPGIVALQGDQLSIVIFGGDIALRKNVFSRVDDSIALRSLTAKSIPDGLRGRHTNETAYVPIHATGRVNEIPSLRPIPKDSKAKLPEPDWSVDVADSKGNTMQVNVRGHELQDLFSKELLAVRNRGDVKDKPRLIAMVRIIKPAGKDKQGKATQPVGELVALRKPEAALPVALRVAKPGKDEAKVYRVTPTVATLAYTLGFKIDDINSRVGPNLSFTQVVRVLHTLCEQDQIPASFTARINPLAQRIASAQRDNPESNRAEFNPGDFDTLTPDGKTKNKGNQGKDGSDGKPQGQPKEPVNPDSNPDSTPAKDEPKGAALKDPEAR